MDKLCPLKKQLDGLDKANSEVMFFGPCDGEKCAWWNRHLDMCNLAVPGYLAGLEAARRDA